MKQIETIIQYLKYWSEHTPNKIAFTFLKYEMEENVQEESITCQQIYQTARKYSTFFKQKAIEQEEPVIVLAKQTPETIYTIYGLMMIGAIPVLMPYPFNDSKMRRLKTTIRNSGAKWLTGIDENKQLPEDFNVKILYPRNNTNNLPMITETEMTISNFVCLLYTSGSIHLPKGVMISHKNNLSSLKLIENSYHATPEDIYISWAPYYHIMGLFYTVFWNAYSNRKDIVIKTENYLENPKRWFKAIQDYHGTMTMAPNSAYLTSVREANGLNLDLSSLRYAGNGSEPVLENEYQEIVTFLKNAGVSEYSLYNNYGLSESSGIISEFQAKGTLVKLDSEALKNNCVKLLNDFDAAQTGKKIITAGKILGNTKAVLIHPEDLSISKQDEVGELYLQGDSIACGYWHNEEGSKETFETSIPGYDGTFLRTGDLGFFHNDLLYILGRCKEMIVINGKNIYPYDVTVLLKEKLKILSESKVCAFSVETNNREELIIAVEYIGNYKAICSQIEQILVQFLGFGPYDIIFVPKGEIPHTDNGKLSVKRAADYYLTNKIQIDYSMRYADEGMERGSFSKTAQKIKEIFESILGERCYSVNDNFFEIGGNSLHTLSLLKRLKEVFGVYVTTDELLESATIKSIEQCIQKKLNT